MTATDTSELSTAEIEAERLRRKREVALGYRIFASLRWGDLGDGHITARDPEHTDCMWLLRYPVGFERATIDDLVLVRADGTTVDGRPINDTAYHIHHPIHAARDSVIGVAHTHTPWGTPFCATGRGLEPLTQEACQFYDRWAFFDDEEVQVLSSAGGERIAQALGQNQVVLLRVRHARTGDRGPHEGTERHADLGSGGPHCPRRSVVEAVTRTGLRVLGPTPRRRPLGRRLTAV
jgi:ribulose-5-phosphate 4-epimerase/fuculose-1-phosphate aldolase